MDDIKKLMKRCLQTACNAVTDAHLEAIGEDREMSLAEWEEIMVDALIANGVTIPVRCKDCQYWENGKDYEPYCNHWGNMMAGTEADDFCSYGERRTDDGQASV